MKMYLQISILYDMLVWYELNYSIAPNQGKGGNYHGKSLLLYRSQDKSGNNRSHAMNSTKRTVKPNLQKVRVMVDGKPKKVWVSTRALKSGKVERV